MNYPLGSSEIHVWVLRTAAVRRRLSEAWAVLSSLELERAHRFRVDHAREMFLFSRYALRLLLGSYVGEEPARVELEIDWRGKPHLVGNQPLRFNLSHSGDLAAFAFRLQSEIGVDIEQVRPVRDRDALAHRFFSTGEAQRLKALPEAERDDAFFRIWTRKEAVLKALGDGLAIPLDRFRVAFLPGDAPEIVHAEPGYDHIRALSLHAFEPEPGYAGALACSGARGRVRYFASSVLEQSILRGKGFRFPA